MASTNKLPVLVWVVAISTIIACVGGTQFFGYNIAGYAWVVPLFFSFISFLKEKGEICFPYKIWLPWFCVVVGYLIVADTPNALQRSVMLICPLFIGMTVSKYGIAEETLENMALLYKYLAISLYIVILLKTGMFLTGVLPEITGLAPEVMTGALLCTFFAASYAMGEKKVLAWWVGLAAIPVIALTRMGIVASGVSLPGTFAPMKIKKRLALLCLIVLLAVPIFYSERVQQKMFFSGEGMLSEIQLDNPNFRNTGRKFIWDAMAYQIEQHPWFGHGANSSEQFVSMLTGGLTHPHNDWLRLRYDYGYFGTTIFSLCLVFQLLHILKGARYSSKAIKTFLYASASSFVVFTLFMLSDNIILYAAFFGNMQFTMIGLTYAAKEKHCKEETNEQAISRSEGS